jgi:SAM-dependent methyltransferase
MEMNIIKNESDILEFISNRCFTVLKDKTVLELGPQNGTYFTPFIEQVATSVTCIEFNPIQCGYFKNLYANNPKVKLLQDDFHDAVNYVGYHDAVVLFGVLYHSPAPLKIIEDIVNNIAPKIILLESWNNKEPTILMTEEINVDGNRQSRKKTCGFALTHSAEIYISALKSLGYQLIEKFELNDEIKTDLKFKQKAIYMTFINQDVENNCQR